MKISAFITHKKSERYSDCQDRFSVNVNTKSIAVSDGMSQSYQQKIWASLLVESYTSGALKTVTEEKLYVLRVQWKRNVIDFIETLRADPTKEYLFRMNTNALALQKSAAATLLGIQFDGNKWEGIVLGDTCLIELDSEHKVLEIYTSQDKEFDNYPDFLDSTTIGLKQKGQVRQISGELKPGHVLLLVSDPFSDIIHEFKNGKIDLNIDDLLKIQTHDEFCQLVDRWRREKGMTNDDSTLVIVTHDSTSDFNIVHADDILALIDEEKVSEEPAPETESGPKCESDDTSSSNEAQEEQEDPEVKDEQADSVVEEIIQEILVIGWWNRIRRKKLAKKLERILSNYIISKINQ